MKKSLPFLIGAPIILLVAIGAAFVTIQFSIPKPAVAEEDTAAHKDNKENAVKDLGPGPMLVMKERVVNLTDPGTSRYLKMAASIEFKPEKAEYFKASGEERKKMEDEFRKSMVGRQTIIEDLIIATASSKKSTDLATQEGKERLKRELREKISNVVHEPEVVNIYFTEFVMQ